LDTNVPALDDGAVTDLEAERLASLVCYNPLVLVLFTLERAIEELTIKLLAVFGLANVP
jgi:hypothetical protein